MRKEDVLVWGMQHIANNYGVKAGIDLKANGAMCVYGRTSPAIINDVKMLCKDIGLPDECVEVIHGFGVDVYLDSNLIQEIGLLGQDYTPTGRELWKHKEAIIGK